MILRSALLLANAAILASAAPQTRTSPSEQTPAPVPTRALQPRSPEFTGVSISHVSVSITPVSIKPHSSISLSLNLPIATCTQTIVPDKNGYVPPGTCGALFNYYPSFAAAIMMSTVFGIISTMHVVQAALYKTGFCWVAIMGVLWQFGGYLTRAFATRDQQSSGLVTVSQLLVLLSPLWINAFDYMVLARMIHFFVPSKMIFLKPSFLAMIFVCLDFASFIIQLVGGGMAAPGSPDVMKGVHIYQGGIAMQQAFLLVFFVFAIKFHIEMLKAERSGALSSPKAKWRWMLYPLYTSLVFISVRIIYRLAEFSGGMDESNPLPFHEVYAYVFDAIPMLFAIIVWNISHPGSILQGSDAVMPSSGLRRIFCCRRKRKEGRSAKSASSEDFSSTENVHYVRQNHSMRYS